MKKKNGALVQWTGWLSKVHIAWLAEQAEAQPFKPSPAAVLRGVLDQAIEAEKKRKAK